MYDLSKTKILSFEIGNKCNLAKEHKECPINRRKYINTNQVLSAEKIAASIKEAKELNFNGYIAFHYYNEPLLYKDKMMKIMELNGEDKYLLWTNGELLNENVKENQFLRQFTLVNITCYKEERYSFYNALKEEYGNIKLIKADLDDRLDIYGSDFYNQLSCKRPVFELPIDYYGNVHLCCFDWNNVEVIGNVNESGLKNVIQSDNYQRLLYNATKRLIDQRRDEYPEICLKCNHALIFLPKVNPYE